MCANRHFPGPARAAATAFRKLAVLTLSLAACGAANAQSPFDPPPAPTLTEARRIVQSMIDNPRGPYTRLRWFCADGTVQPPQAFACRDHGGGHQHAEFSADRQRLAELGWSVGTIFAALDWDELWDAGRRHQRLRELPIERYLQDIDDGWVLRQARDYRGRVQIEDEERAGRELLERLLADRAWVDDNFLLVRESVRAISHGGAGEDRTRTVRRDAIALAELDPSFERIRVEIHTAPTAATAARVRAWAKGRDEARVAAATALAAELDALFGEAGRRSRMAALARRFGGEPALAGLGEALDLYADETSPADRLALLAGILRDAREVVVGSLTPANRLRVLDLVAEVESELGVTTATLMNGPPLTREALLKVARQLVDASYAVGLLSPGERRALADVWHAGEDDVSLADYSRSVDYLRRLPQWAVGSVRYTFAEPLIRYTALDARAGAFVDDLLRSSPLFGISEVTRRLSRDLASLSGVTQSVNGRSGVSAFGLNPGVAIGSLRLFETAEALEAGSYARGDIVLLPETVSELRPVAGILTLGEGSPLSHVQLLARNFGIPNIALVPDALPLIRPLEGAQVLTAVASDGSLVVTAAENVDAGLRDLLRPANERGGELTVPRPDLDWQDPVPLADLNASLSGRIVGPKAANLGQLARLFPGRVAPAVAVPFGIFADHMNAGSPSLRSELVAAYEDFRTGAIGETELATRLARVRERIAALEIMPAHRDALVAAMQTEFGDNPSLGLFVRSDTNVEDLPQFTGAGLSETLPNLVGLEAQLAAIPRVWASVLSPRAIAWRSNLLTNPEEVYASVLLMQSVPSDKSGVLVTTDLTRQGAGVTVSTGWGVGGTVAGEAVETLVLYDDGRETLVSEAKTAYRRELAPTGGLQWQPAAAGAVLTAAEKAQLRSLAVEVGERYAPVFDDAGRQRPWDIEFGFVDGELALFQIRPLVERGPELADRFVRALSPQSQAAIPGDVSLAAYPTME